MKKILLILLLPLLLAAQTEHSKSLIELKTQLNTELSIESNPLQLQTMPQKKSPGLAIIYSLVLPGMGELYADSYNSGIYFTIADAVFWGAFAGINIYGNWKEDSYRSFAKSRGDVKLDGKDEQYFADIGNYADIFEYNREQELNRNFDAVYNTETHFWKWENNNQRREYRDMWSSSENAFNNVRFAVGALIVNRIVSAINAVRLVSAYNNRVDEMSWNVSVGMTNQVNLPTSLNLNFSTSF